MGVKTLVSTVTVGAGGAASIQFTSIPQTGTDLLVVLSARGSTASATASSLFYLNGATTAYNAKWFYGDGSTTSSSSGIGIPVNGANSTTNTFGNASFYIPNYASSLAKTISIEAVTENNAAEAWQNIKAHSWNGTSAVTSISVIANANTFAQYSTASLYIITKGSGGATVA